MKKEQIEEIISKMTLHEKVLLCTGKNSWRTRDYEKLGIPSILVSDGTSGVRFQIGSDQPEEMSFYDSLGGSFDNEEAMSRTYRATCFPSGSAIASSWDTELIGEIGKKLAGECKELGINMLLGPGMNIHRHPLTARNFEYYSEDPGITGEMAAAIVSSVQHEGVGTCMKHFACHNSDSRRTRVNVHVSERALREIYLAGYERVVRKAHPVSLMTAYNKINGEEVSGDNRITRDILKGEWGFDGTVVCDWGAVKDPVEASKGRIDLQMPLSKSSAAYLEQAVETGQLDEKLVDERVARILKLVFQLKEWEAGWDTVKHEDSHWLAVEAAAESMVLVKNENQILPLKPQKGEKIAVLGHMAKEAKYQGTGCAAVHARKVDIPYDQMIPYLTECEVKFAEGYQADGTTTDELIREAVQTAKEADQVLLFVGSFLPGEDDDYNRKDIKLSEGMTRLIDAVSAVNKNCIVILSSGEVCEMPWRHQVSAVLLTWFSGEGMGSAIADILFGKVSPSGRLANTVPERLQDTPAYLSFDGNVYEIPYAEDIYVGYRYYEKKGIQPAYPFGYGLSYTSFEYDHLAVSEENDHTIVTVDVTNTGAVAAKHVVELFIEPKMKTRLPRPVRELKAFKKIFLQPGEKKQVCFSLERRDFAYYDPKVKDWVIENGTYAIEICHDSMNVAVSAEITKSGEKYLVPLGYDCGFHEMFQYPEVKKMFYEFLVEQGLVTADQVNDNLEKGIIWSFWAVRSYLDMNSNGLISFEAYNRFIDRANEVIKKMKAK